MVDAGCSSVLYLAMLFFLSRQITASRTPAGISRLSRWTFFAQALIDSFAFVIVGFLFIVMISPHTGLTLGMKLISLAPVVNSRISVPLIAPAALAVILLTYEMVSSRVHPLALPLMKRFNGNSLC